MSPKMANHMRSKIRALLEEWSKAMDSHDRRRVKLWCHDFAHLSRLLSDLRQKRQSRNVKNAEDWNPFRIARVGHLETKLHTPFLKALFDCNGGHGQGTLFFKLFLHQLTRLPGGPPTKDIHFFVSGRFQSDYMCREEVFDRESGRMDLIIERRFGLDPFCIIIENKIRAFEQSNQLERYLSYLKKHVAPSNRCFLVYLHAFGDEHRPKSGNNCLVMRYQNQITNMLRQADTYVRAQTVRDTLRQYRAVIDEL